MAAELFVGTSGFSYSAWKGRFYPEKTRAADMLRFYASRFGSVEMNSTFYRMPTPAVISGWAAQVPETFRFVLKAPRRITHDRRLSGVEELLVVFLNAAIVLAGRLGPLLFQLPPNLKKDVALLRDFLALVPGSVRAALEFRHPSWLDDEVFEALRERGAALCVADTDEETTPLVPTAGWGYLRLRRAEYAERELADWLGRVRAAPWSEGYVFFKHEDEARGPVFATRFLELAAAG